MEVFFTKPTARKTLRVSLSAGNRYIPPPQTQTKQMGNAIVSLLTDVTWGVVGG